MNDSAELPDEVRARLIDGDREVLAELFSQHYQRLWKMVSFRLAARLSGRIDADDVLQEAYLEAEKRLPHYKIDTTMSPFVWLRFVVAQTLIDVHRRHLGAQMRDAGREVSLHRQRYPQATSASLAARLLGQMTSPSQAAMRSELADQLETAIANMNEIDQEVLALRHFEELTNSEVAEVLDLTQKAASIRYVRAIARLKDVLVHIPGFLDLSGKQSSTAS